MNGIEALSANPAVDATAQALMHFLWQGALVGLATGWILTLLKRGKASVRYAVGAVALLLMAALPFLTAFWLIEPAGLDAGAMAVSGEVTPALETTIPIALSLTVPSRDFILPAMAWVFGLWLVGVIALSVYHLGGWHLARTLRHRGTRPVSREMEARLRELARRMGIVRAVGFFESSALTVPAVIGFLRPAVLVPASTLAGLSPQQLEAILAHELAHVRRHDYLVNLLQTMVETLLFYHPAVWWVSAQVRRERENCCDDLAVAACGDRLGYARALVDLEGLRAPRPRLAMAADGGSLVERIRRLAGVPSHGPRRSTHSWLAGLLALSLFPMGVTFNLLVAPSAVNAQEKAPASRGTWSAEREGNGKISIDMRMKTERGNWGTSSTYNESFFQGLGAGPEARFELRRDAGTFRFQGRFEGAKGSGFFTFEGNPAYVREMEAMGRKVAESRLLDLAMHDVSLDFVRQVGDLGYSKVSLDRLIEFRIHGVSPEGIRELQSLGYRELPSEKLVEFRIHGVSSEGIRELESLGYENLPPQKLVEFRIHGVTPEDVRELQSLGYRNLSPDKLVEFRIHGVTPDFIRKASRQGHKNLSADNLVQMKIHGELDR